MRYRKSDNLKAIVSDAKSIRYESRWGSTPEPPKFPLPQFQPGDQHIQVNNFIAVLEGIMPVQQNVLPGHRRYRTSRSEVSTMKQ